MKECFAITSYCNTAEKVNILEKTINNINQYGLDVIVHAHHPLSIDIQKIVKSYFYSSENPILKTRFNKFWYFTHPYKLEITVYDYYFTTLKGWTELIDICQNYDRIHILNYDANISNDFFNLSRKYSQSIFLQNKDTSSNYILPIYFCLNKISFDYFKSNITLEKYLAFNKPNGPFLPLIEEFIPTFIIGDEFLTIPHWEYDESALLKYDVMADTRFYWDKTLDIGVAKIFIGEYKDIARALFFDIKESIEISIIINGRVLSGKSSETEFFNLGLPFRHINNLQIKINDMFLPDDLIKKFFQLECKIYIE